MKKEFIDDEQTRYAAANETSSAAAMASEEK